MSKTVIHNQLTNVTVELGASPPYRDNEPSLYVTAYTGHTHDEESELFYYDQQEWIDDPDLVPTIVEAALECFAVGGKSRVSRTEEASSEAN